MRIVPSGLEVPDTMGEGGLGDVSGLHTLTEVVGLNAVVDGVDWLDEFVVEFGEDDVDARIIEGGLKDVGDDLLAKVLVDETSTAEFDVMFVIKGLEETTLVVVIAVLFWDVLGPDIDEDGQRVKHLGVSGADDLGAFELVGLTEHEAGEGLVTVELTAVCANDFFLMVCGHLGERRKRRREEGGWCVLGCVGALAGRHDSDDLVPWQKRRTKENTSNNLCLS